MEKIHAYTRANAIADGTLVDVTNTAREAGWRYPVAVTAAVWEDCIAWDDADNTRKGTLQDEDGRLWDVVYMAYRATATHTATPAEVHLHRVPRDGDSIDPEPVTLHVKIGTGDVSEPGITITQPDED